MIASNCYSGGYGLILAPMLVPLKAISPPSNCSPARHQVRGRLTRSVEDPAAQNNCAPRAVMLEKKKKEKETKQKRLGVPKSGFSDILRFTIQNLRFSSKMMLLQHGRGGHRPRSAVQAVSPFRGQKRDGSGTRRTFSGSCLEISNQNCTVVVQGAPKPLISSGV